MSEPDELTREQAVAEYPQVAAAPAEYLDVLFDTDRKPRSEVQWWLTSDPDTSRLVLFEKAEAMLQDASDNAWRARRTD